MASPFRLAVMDGASGCGGVVGERGVARGVCHSEEKGRDQAGEHHEEAGDCGCEGDRDKGRRAVEDAWATGQGWTALHQDRTA